MYCSSCGSYLNDNCKYCPNCGKRLDNSSLNISSVQSDKKTSNEEVLAILGIVLSVIAWPIGLVISIVALCTFKDQHSRKLAKTGLIVGIVLPAIVFVFFIIVVIIFFANPNILFPGGL